MNLLHRLPFPALVGVLFVLLFFSSCEEDLTTIGEDVIGGQPFSTGKEVYDVFAYNNNIEAVQTNKLGVYQLGVFNDPIYGKTEAQITSQIQLASGNPTFGSYSQESEDAADTDDSIFTIEEEETVTQVYLYIPYLTKTTANDTDGDGVVDEFDSDDDADNDNDGDGRTNLEEAVSGTDPLDATSVDADLDGYYDPSNSDLVISNNYAKQIDIDSIYGGDVGDSFNLTVKRSTFFLRDYDAATNFTESEKYYSNIDYSSFATETLTLAGEEDVVISDKEYLIPGVDDESTEDVNEEDINTHLNPGIRISLNETFFQENIVDKEGSSELLSQANFKEYIRGLHLSLTSDQDIMVLLDMSKAVIVMTYEYESYNINSTTDDTLDDTVDTETKDYTFSFIGTTFTGNAVNTFINEDYPTEINDAFTATEAAEKIYLKGGAGTYAEIDLFSSNATLSASIIDEIKANNWIINEANLVFYVDDAANLNESSIKPPRLYLFNTETNAGIYNAANEYSTDTSSPFGIFLNYDGFLEESGSDEDNGDIYTIRITDHINDIVLRDSVNRTLGLTITPNINISGALNAKVSSGDQELPAASIISPLSTVLYANPASFTGKKLKLEIHYSEAN